jgi:hypothetical protein
MLKNSLTLLTIPLEKPKHGWREKSRIDPKEIAVIARNWMYSAVILITGERL